MKPLSGTVAYCEKSWGWSRSTMVLGSLYSTLSMALMFLLKALVRASP